MPAIDLKRLIAWVFFNIFTGNNDSHAKNLSLFRPAVGGVRLTPFYDLMCTRIYPGLSQNFAFDIGGTTIPGEMEQRHISALASAAASMQDALQPGDVTMAKRVNFYVVNTAKQASKRIKLGV